MPEISSSSTGRDLRHHFNNGYIRTHGVEEAGKFDTDSAGTDNQQALGHDVRFQSVEIGPDQFLIRLKARKNPRTGTGCQNDVLGLVGASIITGNGDRAFALKNSFTLDPR